MISQELLGRQLIFKREIATLKDRLAVSERETSKIAATAKAHHNDKVLKPIKIALLFCNCTFEFCEVQ